jgi:hypothetical protein
MPDDCVDGPRVADLGWHNRFMLIHLVRNKPGVLFNPSDFDKDVPPRGFFDSTRLGGARAADMTNGC